MTQSRVLGELAQLVGGELQGDPALRIRGIASLEDAAAGDLSFVTGRQYVGQAEASRAAAFIVPPELDLPGRPLIRVARPYLAVAALLREFHPEPTLAAGIHATAVIAPSARVAPDATVLAFAVVGGSSAVEARAVLHPHVTVGERCRIGERTVLHPHVVLRGDVDIGQGVVIHAGTVIGADGFGYVFDGTRHRKIPQVGRIVIEDDVEIGANVTIDRATIGATVIGRGTKIDNLVQIGHNVVIGSDTIIVAQTGISGSCRIGHRVVLGGQVGVADHAVIGDGAQVGSQSGVRGTVAPGAAIWGTPALPIAAARRVAGSLPRLPELVRTIRALAKRIAELERRLRAVDGASP
ncbi:MAG: UDP-3-O-(3-hydroxymyristoyl)glucosamine N-acyltransferase [Candidatus Rokuibacteriota bacterium]